MIFVDTGAWFALAVRNDPDHVAAMAWLERNREPLVTTDYILAETATLTGLPKAMRIWNICWGPIADGAVTAAARK